MRRGSRTLRAVRVAARTFFVAFQGWIDTRPETLRAVHGPPRAGRPAARARPPGPADPLSPPAADNPSERSARSRDADPRARREADRAPLPPTAPPGAGTSPDAPEGPLPVTTVPRFPARPRPGAFVLLLASTLACLLGACAGTGGQLAEEDRPPETEAGTDAVYRLGAGDVVAVSVWKNPDLSVTVPVRPDGFISVPLVGDIRAGGRTPAEIAVEAESQLTRFIRTPKVSIIVEELNSAEFKNRVRVVGGVAEPKSIAHRDGMTVIDLVLEAGGLTDFAAPDNARLIRTVEGQTRTYPVYLDAILVGGVVDTNYRLQPGDVVTVPERRF